MKSDPDLFIMLRAQEKHILHVGVGVLYRNDCLYRYINLRLYDDIPAIIRRHLILQATEIQSPNHPWKIKKKSLMYMPF